MIALIIRFLLFITGGSETMMIDIYVALIVAHRRTIEQVPAQLRADVMADLTALGLDGNGNPIQNEGGEMAA